MAKRAARPCLNCGAATKNHPAYCDQCGPPIHRQRYDQRRGSASRRGYGYRWRQLRQIVLHEKPLCADPFGHHDGAIVMATEVDHRIPLRAGGTNVTANLQSLCKSCHSKKTASERQVSQ